MDVQSMYTTRAFTCAIADKQPILDLLVACDRPKSVVESLSNYKTPNPPFTLYQAHLMSGCFLGEPGNLRGWTTIANADCDHECGSAATMTQIMSQPVGSTRAP